MKCKDCDYWSSLDQENGQCRKNAPKVITDGYEVGSLNNVTAWPETRATDGCGEIKLKQ